MAMAVDFVAGCLGGKSFYALKIKSNQYCYAREIRVCHSDKVEKSRSYQVLVFEISFGYYHPYYENFL